VASRTGRRAQVVVTRAQDIDTELESVSAAVEALKAENEKLKSEIMGEGADAAAPAAAAPTATAVGGSADPYAEEDAYIASLANSYPPVEGDGLGVCLYDPTLNEHRDHLGYRWYQYKTIRDGIDTNEGGLEKFSRGYEFFGFNRVEGGIMYREWAPGARAMALVGDFNNWTPTAEHWGNKNEFGTFELFLPDVDGVPAIPHGSAIKARVEQADGTTMDKIPAWIKMAVQPPGEIAYNGVYYEPPVEEQYVWKHPRPKTPKALRIYEAHVGMSSPEPKISTYAEFRDNVLPRISYLGYNAVQLMAIQEHAYYASFGYHVTNFFAVSSRCGTPDELKSLIDEAHRLGIVVLCDIVHSHASNNINDGINMFDGTGGMYFHEGPQGYHWMWDSRCFNYGNWEVLRFLLSNLRYWVSDLKFDGFRFDGATSMMYKHHGLGFAFTGNYGEYFGMDTDVDALVYMMIANDMLHTLLPESSVTVAEDVSGMPTLCRPVAEGGVGFDYRLQMAIADKWIEVLGEWGPDEMWDMGNLTHTMENRRWGEKCISYAESHDQALVGDKTIAFWLMDANMYTDMSTLGDVHPTVARGIALHKMIRMFTMCLGGEGYLNFMGNEFGHPEWIDFPRDDRYEASTGKFVPGNGNSYHLCRRRFDLPDTDHLRYKHMYHFDAAMNKCEGDSEFLSGGHQYTSRKDNDDKMIVVERGDLVFVFNWHPTNSYSDYRVGCKDLKKYKIVLNSDREEFGGFENVKEDAEFFADDFGHDGRPYSFQVYAPARTVVVYAPDEIADPLGEYCDSNPNELECRTFDD